MSALPSIYPASNLRGGFLGPLVYPDLEKSQKSIEAAVRLVLPISPELFISK